MDTIKKKKFKSNLIQLTPDDLHKTALKIQEKSFHGQTSEYLMLNVLRGNEFDEWSRYLKFVYIEISIQIILRFHRAGFNILLHGVGSKKSLVALFLKKYLKNEFLTFIINGFLPNITIKQVYRHMKFSNQKLIQ